MPKLTVANLVDRAARKFGDKPFVRSEHEVKYENIGLDLTQHSESAYTFVG